MTISTIGLPAAAISAGALATVTASIESATGLLTATVAAAFTASVETAAAFTATIETAVTFAATAKTAAAFTATV